MKNLCLIVTIVLFSTLLIFAGQKELGKKLTLKVKTPISKILDNPKKFEGKKVLVEGTILAVCEKRGCWMEISSDKEMQKIKIKVKDGDIVFPLTAVGKKALVEGEVYKISMTKEEAIKQGEHEAEERKSKFDPKSITGPVTFYQIKGLGAVITE
jgi:co-chaperonin GroES (HSP10)